MSFQGQVHQVHQVRRPPTKPATGRGATELPEGAITRLWAVGVTYGVHELTLASD